MGFSGNQHSLACDADSLRELTGYYVDHSAYLSTRKQMQRSSLHLKSIPARLSRRRSRHQLTQQVDTAKSGWRICSETHSNNNSRSKWKRYLMTIPFMMSCKGNVAIALDLFPL